MSPIPDKVKSGRGDIINFSRGVAEVAEQALRGGHSISLELAAILQEVKTELEIRADLPEDFEKLGKMVALLALKAPES